MSRRRNPFDFQFEKPQAYGRHTPITMSPSDPNPDVQQDDNYATTRRAATWNGPPFAVRALTLRADSGMSMAGIGVVGGIIRHIALQFWHGLDPTAFAGFLLTGFALAFRKYRQDDTRYGALHSVLWALAAIFVVGRIIAVYLNLYPSSVPGLGVWAVDVAGTGQDLDGWMRFVAKAPFEWMMIVALIVAWFRVEPDTMANDYEPPTLWHDRFTPPASTARTNGAGLFGLAFLIPILAPAAATRTEIFYLLLIATTVNLVVAYVIAVELSDYGKTAIQNPDHTYTWFHAFSPRRFQALEFLALAVPRLGLPMLAGLITALALGRFWCAGAAIIAAFATVTALLAPRGSGKLYDRLVLIFLHYPGGADERPAAGRFAMSGLVYEPEARNALLGLGAFTAATAIYSLQTLVPTWPAVDRYWFFITDLPAMDYTAIALSILFQAFGTVALARCTFVAAYGQILKDRFDAEGNS